MDVFGLELSNPCATPKMNTVPTGILDTFVCYWTPSFQLVKTYSETEHHHNPLKVGSLNKEGSRELGMAEDSIPHNGGVSLYASGHRVSINLQAMIAVRIYSHPWMSGGRESRYLWAHRRRRRQLEITG